MTNIWRILENLAGNLRASEVMVPRSRLVCGDTADEALHLLEGCPEYDMIPIPKSGDISSYAERDSHSVRNIEKQDLTSEGTTILDLVETLVERKRLFVLAGRSIAGYVHYSDLNNPLVKIPFFIILESVETLLASKLDPILSETVLRDRLDPNQFDHASRRMAGLRNGKADLNWTSSLNFSQIVNLASDLSVVELGVEERRCLIGVRNRIAHAARPLVGDEVDVANLANTKRISFDLLSRHAI